jgi:SAM-dependent methyltransferase
VDAAAEVIAQAEARGADRHNLEFIVGDAYALPFENGTFDVAHAHQTLQHVADPVAVLREMRRVTKPGGIVAARDVDYAGTFWYPELPGLSAWRDLYETVHRSNGGEPDAGRRLKAWALEAGFEQLTSTASVWNFSDSIDREWWGSMWAERVLKSAFASDAISKGLATQQDLEAISAAWREWADSAEGWLLIPHGEIVAVA